MKVQGGLVFDFINAMAYYWRRSGWVVSPRHYLASLEKVRIHGPVFLLGNQGDGLTLISRMLRRHPKVVSITGDSSYWSGADEMQKVMMCQLPPSLRLGGRWFCKDVHHPLFTPPRSWSYASNDLISYYRKTADDYNEKDARLLRRIIQDSIYRFGRGESKRFVDKSQVFSVKMSFVDALLKDTSPHFVLVTRNPYATIYRAAMGKAGDMRRYAKYMSLDERVEVCLQHWLNTMKSVMEDKDKVSNFTWIRFEDMLRNPKETLLNLTRFLGLTFIEDMIPAPHHRIPLGSKYRDRWYPLRPDVNERYLKEIPEKYLRQIEERCGAIAAEFGYHPPRKVHKA